MAIFLAPESHISRTRSDSAPLRVSQLASYMGVRRLIETVFAGRGIPIEYIHDVNSVLRPDLRSRTVAQDGIRDFVNCLVLPCDQNHSVAGLRRGGDLRLLALRLCQVNLNVQFLPERLDRFLGPVTVPFTVLR